MPHHLAALLRRAPGGERLGPPPSPRRAPRRGFPRRLHRRLLARRVHRDGVPRSIATIAFTFQPLADFTGLDALAPLYFRSTEPASRGGYEVEFRELWGQDGRLLALNQQTICVIK